MSKEFILFEKDKIPFKYKFYRLMDLLITNQSTSRLESIILFGVFYLQIITGFFSTHVQVLNVSDSSSDAILNYLQRIFRVKDLFIDNFSGFQIIIYLLLAAILLSSVLFLLIMLKVSKNSTYTYKEHILNFLIKVFLFVAFNPILDLTLANFCFDDINPHFSDMTCEISTYSNVFAVSLLLLIVTIILGFLIQIYYDDSHFLSNSYFAKMSCDYSLLFTLNCLVYAVLLSQSRYISNFVFLIYNFVISLLFLNFFLSKYLFYDKITNIIVGIFHILYAWTSLFFLIFANFGLSELGVIYILSSAIIIYFYFNLKVKIEDDIILKTPYFKITNKYYLMYYLRSLIDKIHNVDTNVEDKAILIGIIKTHINECPNPECITKFPDKRIFLPVTDEWSYREKPEIADRVFLLNFILAILNYFISQSYYSPDMLINISLYQLQVIGNYCQAMFFYKKVKELKLSIQENFSFIRLNFAISKALVSKLKPPNEPCPVLEDLNTTYYFKYEDLSQKFYEEIYNDVNLSLEFWKCFKQGHNDLNSSRTIDFNRVFNLTDKIRITKAKVEKIWSQLYRIFSGVNDLFELYQGYVEQINDDDLLKRDLDAMKSKNLNSTEHIQSNFYNLLFNRDTGILIVNGDKGKEGIVERANDAIEKIFEFKPEELRGMNVSHLMPSLFEKQHKLFMERFFLIGEKRVLDNKEFKSYGKDKQNSLIPLKLCLKLFPMLNDSVYFVGLMVKENLDDLILIDSNFNIQGMSRKLMEKMKIENKNLFHEAEVPFYIICKKFINFYKIFLSDKLAKKSIGEIDNDLLHEDEMPEEKKNKLEVDVRDIEINENIELEYEIQIPQFLQDYSNITNQANSKQEVKLIRTITGKSNESDLDVTGDHEDEKLLASKEMMSPKKATTRSRKSLYRDKSSQRLNKDENITSSKDYSDSRRIGFNKQTEIDKEFQTKINHCRNAFESGRFTELEEIIDNYLVNSEGDEFKFNFTFDRYKFGDKQNAYVVRCIDNKNEIGRNDEDSEHNGFDDDVKIKHKKAKIGALKDLVEILPEEKKEIFDQQTEFLKLAHEDREFINFLSDYKNEIYSLSKVHGVKKEDAVIDEENSSQSSQTGYNEDLSKKSRIEEIRSNIMLNISNFYTLKWIKAIFYIVIILTAGFCAGYLIIFDKVYDELIQISDINIGLYDTTIWMTNTIASLISMRSLYNFKRTNFPINYLAYTLFDHNLYFDSLRGFSNDWYNKIIKTFGKIENDINLYLMSTNDYSFWEEQKVNYLMSPIQDTEKFPLALMQVLTDTNNLLSSPYFNLNQTLLQNTTDHTTDLLNYSGYLSIENAIDNILPRQFSLIKSLPPSFMKYNLSNMQQIMIIILVYGFTMLLFACFYLIFLHLTNKNMGEGLEKVSKIKNEKVEEVIRRIEIFNEKYLSKIKHREAKFNNEELKNTKVDSYHDKMNNGRYSSSERNFKKLRILTYSYFQIVILILIIGSILIPIYFVSLGVVESTNKIITFQNFLFGKCLIASASTVKIKCDIANCLLAKPLDTKVLEDPTVIEQIIIGIADFPELSVFYNQKFLLNACATIYNQTTPEYDRCMGELIIQSANNTYSLLKLIDETVITITKDQEMKRTKPYVNINNQTVAYNNVYSFETFYFLTLEYVFYDFIAPVSDSFSIVARQSLLNFLTSQKILIIILISLFGICILLFSVYVTFIFTTRLVHLLSVSRCILRIIPTNVINSTQELESWIENKY